MLTERKKNLKKKRMTKSPELSGALTPCLNPTMVFPHQPRRALQSQTYRMLIRVLSHCDALQASINPSAQGEEGFLELDSALIKESLVLGEAKGSDASKDASLLDYEGISKLGNEKLMALGATHVENHSTLSPGREHNVYDGGSGNVVYESVKTSTSMEVLADVVRSVGIDDEKSPISVVNHSEGMEHELQLKQRELEELIISPQNMDLVAADDGVEEGEISGGNWVDDGAIDLFFGDSVSLEEKNSDDLLVSEENGRKLENGDDRDGQDGISKIKRSPLLDKVEGGNDVKNLEKSTREEPNAGVKSFRDSAFSNYVDLDDGRAAEVVSVAKELLPSVISAENIGQRRQITYEDIISNKGSATAPMEVGVEKKKRGPLTKERKAKRKRKDRIKRAEKNKQLGVKRLKLEPVVIPKKVVYCRHYLVGRCQEGDKCKFSHDTTPLTKSTPCSFLARHSCMKGEDCPFDHELSKYPCNNFVSKGFCSRGADCLFKHEGSTIKDPSLISQLSKPELKSQLPVGDSNSKNQVNKAGMANHHLPTKLSSLNLSTGEFTENQASKNPERTSAHVPKGINFISQVRSPITNTSKHEEAAPNLKLSGGVKSSSSMASNQLDNIQKSNETVKKEPLRPPKGINFLSFGKSPLGISANTEKGTSGPVGFSAESVSGVKADNQTGSGLSSFINKMANEASPMPTHTPPGIKVVSGGHLAVDNASAARQTRTGSDSVSSGVGLVSSISTPNHSSALGSHTPSPSLNHCSGNGTGGSSSSKTPVIFNTPTSAQRALQSTLAFAAKIDSGIKLNMPAANPFDVSRHDSSTSTFKG